MTRSIFGWDLPPGCTHKMIEDAITGPEPYPEEDQILEILEAAGVPSDVNDKVLAVVRKLCEDLIAATEMLAIGEELP